MQINKMKRVKRLSPSDIKTIAWSLRIEKNGYKVLQYFSAFVFIWFACLKLLQVDEADLLLVLLSKILSSEQGMLILGVYELIIGISLLYTPWVYTSLKLLGIYICVNFLPFIFMSEHCFVDIAFVLSAEGKAIILHLALLSGAIVIAGRQHIKIIELKG